MIWMCKKNKYYKSVIDDEYIISIIDYKKDKILYQNSKSLLFYNFDVNIINYILENIEQEHQRAVLKEKLQSENDIDFKIIIKFNINTSNTSLVSNSGFSMFTYDANTSISNKYGFHVKQSYIWHKVNIQKRKNCLYVYQQDITNLYKKGNVIKTQLELVKELFPRHIIQNFADYKPNRKLDAYDNYRECVDQYFSGASETLGFPCSRDLAAKLGCTEDDIDDWMCGG